MAAELTGDAVKIGKFVLFWRATSCFSNWFESGFEAPVPFGDAHTDDEERFEFSCSEQYMMAGKARVFGDAETFGEILRTTSPRKQKALGRKVRGFDDATWKARRCEVVELGLYHKFAQNEEIKRQLLATDGCTLVESSPVDRIWGVGLAAEDARCLEPSQWQGSNLLGVCLERVRARLLKEQAEYDAELESEGA